MTTRRTNEALAPLSQSIDSQALYSAMARAYEVFSAANAAAKGKDTPELQALAEAYISASKAWSVDYWCLATVQEAK